MPENSRVKIDSLPEDVLLEIFDTYRQDMELLTRYENIWNSRDGWFKLAHVCSRWRRLVLLSPTRLHVHLLFTPRRSSRVTMLKRLPPFPILVDYRAASWTGREENLALAAISNRSRVRGIALRTTYTDTDKLCRALSHPFPELESLEIFPSFPRDHEMLILPANFLSGSLPCLRRLTLRKVAPRCLSPLLSSATGLVELTLSLHTEWGWPPEASLLSNLPRMSRLRHLELNLLYQLSTLISDPPLFTGTGDIVPLSELTHLIFTGHRTYLEALVVGLAGPSLQHLDAKLHGQSESAFPIPHLCKFIRSSECQFTTIRLVFSRSKLKFYAGMGSESIDDLPFRIIIPEPVSLEQMGKELSGPFSTVEGLTITLDEPWFREPQGPSLTDQWRGFFHHVPQVKMVQVPAREAHNVSHAFQQDGQEPALDLLPALEKVKVDMRHRPHIASSRSDLYTSIRGSFEPLIAAREQVGRPVALIIMDVDVDGGTV
jgi:hypothetical protein